jgi:hypothetical protein
MGVVPVVLLVLLATLALILLAAIFELAVLCITYDSSDIYIITTSFTINIRNASMDSSTSAEGTKLLTI